MIADEQPEGGHVMRARPWATALGPDLLPRPGLVERLLGTPAGGLGIIDSPPGCGGTTLLAAAASQSSSPVAWVSLDARGHSVASFWRHLLDALEQFGIAAVERPPEDPSSAGRPAEEDFISSLVTALENHPTGVLLVLDDLDADAHRVVIAPLRALVETLPRSVRLLVRVRRGQPFDLSRLLSRGRLILLDEDDLALSTTEAEAFLAGAAPQVPPERRALLASLCEGRVGPLAATVAGAGRDPLDDPVAWLLGPGVDLLFQSEVDALEQGDLDLLVGCSVLEVLTPDACDGVLGTTDSGFRLARLERARLVRRRHAEPGSGYRVHGLLAEHLRRRLAQRGRGAESLAHRLAARWLAAQGEVESAITHLLAAGDIREAMSLLETHLSTLLDDGRVAAVRRWYRAAPGTVVTDDVLHLLGSAWAEVMGGNIAGAEHQVLLLHEAVERTSDETAQVSTGADALLSGTAWLAAETELLHAYVDGWHGYPGRLLAHVRRARAFYGDAWDRSAHQVAAFLQIRGHLWAGDPVGARPLLLEAVGQARTREYFRLAVIPSLRALLAVEEGRAHRAAHLAGEAIAWLEANGVLGSVDHCDARLARSRALLDLDDVRGAEAEALLLLGQAEPVKHATYEVLAHLVLAAVRAACGDAVGTMAQINLARQVVRVRAPGSDLLASIDEVEARLRLDLGDEQGSLRLVRRLPPGVERELLLARVLGSRVAGRTGARNYREIRPATPRQVVEHRLLIAGALVRSRPLDAEDHLVAAAEAAYEYGMHRVLVGRPAEVVALADRAGRRAGSVAVSRLVDVARRPRTPVPDHVAVRLSPGEREILTLLPSLRGNAELARELGVSVNTVKTRLRRLFAKLDVHDRDAAVRRAVGLGLMG